MSKLAVVLVEDNYEDLELHYPRLRLIEAGFTVKTVGPTKKSFKSKFGYWANCDTLFNEVDPSSVAVLVIPSGWAGSLAPISRVRCARCQLPQGGSYSRTHLPRWF